MVIAVKVVMEKSKFSQENQSLPERAAKQNFRDLQFHPDLYDRFDSFQRRIT